MLAGLGTANRLDIFLKPGEIPHLRNGLEGAVMHLLNPSEHEHIAPLPEQWFRA